MRLKFLQGVIGTAVMAIGLIAISGCKPSRETGSPAPRKLTVAAASDLKFAMEEMLDSFREMHPEILVEVSYGSSGNFYAQLVHGAPFDLFLSADLIYPERLIEAGVALAETKFVYGIGRLVIWAPRRFPIELEKLGMESLRQAAAKRIAIANPEHAPYGKAAVAALQASGIYDEVASRLIMGENIAQAAHFLQSRGAEVGIIALSLALSPPLQEQGKFWEVPQELHPVLEQGGVILKRAADAGAAHALREFMISAQGREVLKRYGFRLSDRDAGTE